MKDSERERGDGRKKMRKTVGHVTRRETEREREKERKRERER